MGTTKLEREEALAHMESDHTDPVRYCQCCKRVLDDGTSESVDCGGDCRKCLAEVGDDDCRKALGMPPWNGEEYQT